VRLPSLSHFPHILESSTWRERENAFKRNLEGGYSTASVGDARGHRRLPWESLSLENSRRSWAPRSFAEGRESAPPHQWFQILAMLLERWGELVTRDEIRQRLWPGDTLVDSDHGLSAVNRLREGRATPLTRLASSKRIPRQGYRFIAASREDQLT
jgi:DNA-binding response OmpR family regulator